MTIVIGMNMKITIIDYGLGNLASVKNALSHLGIEAVITNNPSLIQNSTHLVLPGVGSFEAGMEGLKKLGLVEILAEEVLEKKKPILGICLGLQLFAEKGFEYGEHGGLGFIKGVVEKIDTSVSKLPLPHIGWNNVSILGNHRITKNLDNEPIFYFVHSYHFIPKDKNIIAGVADYGTSITSIIEKENIFGAQFHPEKSHTDGMQILKNFISI